MALANYSDLQAAVAGMLFRNDLTSQIQTWIYIAEQELSSVLHRREMTQRSTSNTVAGQDSYDLPTDFGEAISLHINSSPIEVAVPSNWDYIKVLYQSNAKPQQWCINDDQIMLGPTPDGVYQIELYYYKVIPNLTVSNTTNWLLTTYPKVYLYSVLKEAAINLRDPNLPNWAQAADDAIKVVLNDQVRDREFGGGPILRADLPFGRRPWNWTLGQ